MFTDEHLTTMRPVLAAVCADVGAALMGFAGEDDHVHLLVGYPPTAAPSKLVNSLKGRYAEQQGGQAVAGRRLYRLSR